MTSPAAAPVVGNERHHADGRVELDQTFPSAPGTASGLIG
jgi:hypothetical protein